MKIYIRNTDTKEILELEADSYESLSKNFRQGPFELAVESEQESFLLKQKKEEKTAQCKHYLNSTDWQHVSFTERGRDYEDVKKKRLKAVSTQDLIEACTTLDELNNINTDF